MAGVLKLERQRVISDVNGGRETYGCPGWLTSEARASIKGWSPLNKETYGCYSGCASFMLEEVSNGPAGFILATHNFE